MGTIKIQNLGFRYDSMLTPLFNNFNLNIDESWKLGLIGRNGRGKTTFLRMLLGQLTYHGDIQSNVRFNYFPQPVAHPESKTADVLMQLAGCSESDLWRIQLEIDKLKLTDEVLDRSFATLSPGEQTKALLAVLFSQNGTFELIDEPTNHLDIEGRQVVADYLKQKTGFIVVSHDRYFIDQVIDHVLSIDRAKIQLFDGNYKTWKREFDRENDSEQSEKQHLKTEVKRLTASANQTKQWASHSESKKSKGSHKKREQNVQLDKGFLGHKSAKIMKRAQSTLKREETAIEEKKGLLKNIDDVPQLALNYERPHQEHLLLVADLQVQRNDQDLNQPLSFDLQRGQRLVLFGPNGIGKTTLIKAIMGQHKLVSNGTISFNATIKTSYLTQNFEQLRGSIADYATAYHVALSELLNMLRKLGFERSAFDEDLSELSMGQKRKVSLARSLCEKANLYIWDEPLNYLDVITRQQIQDLILKIQPTMLVIDHDQAFIEAIKTEPLVKLKSAVHVDR